MKILSKKAQPEAQKKVLESEIDALEVKYQKLDAIFNSKMEELNKSYNLAKELKEKELCFLDNSISLKNKELEVIDLPLQEKTKRLSEKELILEDKEKELTKREETVSKKEQEADDIIEDFQDKIDLLSTKESESRNKERELYQKSKTIKEKEESFIREVIIRNKEIEEKLIVLDSKKHELELINISLKAKEDNLIEREKELERQRIKIESQRKALITAQNAKRR